MAIRSMRQLLSTLILSLAVSTMIMGGSAAANTPKPPKHIVGKAYTALSKAYKSLPVPLGYARPAIQNPSGNLDPNPYFYTSCNSGVDYDNSNACNAAALAAINNALNVDEHIGPMQFNLANFEQLTPPQQIFVITNLERQARHLPPIEAMTSQLNAAAYQGALAHADPKISTSINLTGNVNWVIEDSVWSGGLFNALATDYVYMYADGCPGQNLDCAKNPPVGWGHRENILDEYSNGNCPTTAHYYTGAANVTGQSMAQIMVGTCSNARPTDITFTWQQAQILLSCSPVNGGSVLGPNQILCPNQQLVSPNSAYRLVLQSDGNLVEYGPSGLVWSSNTSGTAVGYLIMRASDSNLVLNDQAGNSIWQSYTYGRGAVQAVLQNDGNLLLQNSSGNTIWSLRTGLIADPPVLYANQRLYTNQYLQSPNGRYSFIMQPDGNLVLYDGPNSIWQSHTFGAPAAYIQLMINGNLGMYSNTGALLWQSRTFGIAPNGQLVIQDDGNLVLKNNEGYAVWSIYSGFTDPSTLSTNQGLGQGHCLVSSAAGEYRLCMQPDGNLVLYNRVGVATWQSGTSGTSASYVIMQPDGNLVMYNSSGNWVWQSYTYGSGAIYVSMQPDGNLVMYNGSSNWVWQTYTEGL
jgi:hypothetical protein